MNKWESVLVMFIIFVFAVLFIANALILAAEKAIESVFVFINAIYSILPPWAWELAILIVVIIGLAFLALWAYQSITKMRNRSAVVEMKSRRALVFQNGKVTAISFEGREITTREIGHGQTLTPDEKEILLRLRIQQEERDSQKSIEMVKSKSIPLLRRL